MHEISHLRGMQSFCQTFQVGQVEVPLINPWWHDTWYSFAECHQRMQQCAPDGGKAAASPRPIDTEESLQLRVEIGKDRAGPTRRPLSATERPRLDTVMVNRPRAGLITQIQPLLRRPIGELDVLPRS